MVRRLLDPAAVIPGERADDRRLNRSLEAMGYEQARDGIRMRSEVEGPLALQRALTATATIASSTLALADVKDTVNNPKQEGFGSTLLSRGVNPVIDSRAQRGGAKASDDPSFHPNIVGCATKALRALPGIFDFAIERPEVVGREVSRLGEELAASAREARKRSNSI